MTKKVIIIDDSPTSLNMLKANFIKKGWEVFELRGSKDALELIYTIAPDLVISDAIMPGIGGFKLVKLIRDDIQISKIPIIVYSVLNENNAKFYIKKDEREFFLKKNDNIDEILSLAEDVARKYPITNEYRQAILNCSQNKSFVSTAERLKKISPVSPKKTLGKNEIEIKFKEKSNFKLDDQKIMENLSCLLYELMEYDLAVIYLKSSDTVYFDIRNIILSPILQNAILNEFSTKNQIKFKKYAPNLKIYADENEFQSKVSFDFIDNDKKIASVIFYSKEKSKWEYSNNQVQIIKEQLDNFFKMKSLNKTQKRVQSNQKKDGYFINRPVFNDINNREVYLGIVEITNFSFLKKELSKEELDILNVRISENIVNYVEQDERIYRIDEDEYHIIILAENEQKAMQRLGIMAELINSVSYDTYNVEAVIGVSKCDLDNDPNYKMARQQALEALELASEEEKTVIKNAK